MLKLFGLSQFNGWQQANPLPFNLLVFSGGETHVELPHKSDSLPARVRIDARVRSAQDFIDLLVLTDAVHRCREVEYVELFIPYFPGARQDRYEHGFALTAKVYADLINAQNYDQVTIVDPHSDVVGALLHRCTIISSADILLFAKHNPQQKFKFDFTHLICPDAGAGRRVDKIANAFGLPVVHASKHRDPTTGDLSDIHLEPLPGLGDYLIPDDICDGGRTFLGLAKKFNEDKFSDGSSLSLYTTHGIYSAGLTELTRSFNRLICTDSWPNGLVHEKLTTIHITAPHIS